ncbi:MAG: hypothetical protein ACRC5R_02730 [Mycoplasmatales bacterium]
MNILGPILGLTMSGLLLSLGALAVGFVVFKISKSQVLASLIMFAFLLIQFDPMTVFSFVGNGIIVIVLIAIILNFLIVLLIGNVIFYCYKEKNGDSKTVKKCCKNKYPRVTTKNKFNKRCLYRLSK